MSCPAKFYLPWPCGWCCHGHQRLPVLHCRQHGHEAGPAVSLLGGEGWRVLQSLITQGAGSGRVAPLPPNAAIPPRLLVLSPIRTRPAPTPTAACGGTWPAWAARQTCTHCTCTATPGSSERHVVAGLLTWVGVPAGRLEGAPCSQAAHASTACTCTATPGASGLQMLLTLPLLAAGFGRPSRSCPHISALVGSAACSGASQPMPTASSPLYLSAAMATAPTRCP